MDGPAGLWLTLFIFSKIPELIDTAFLVIRKKPVIFLHWYHHFTVMLYCWHALDTTAAPGIWFAAMNFFAGKYCGPGGGGKQSVGSGKLQLASTSDVKSVSNVKTRTQLRSETTATP